MLVTALPFPAIDPVLVELGPLAIRWYALAYVAGILLGWLYARRLVADPALWGGAPPFTTLDVDDFITWVTLGLILGGRLGYVIFYNPAFYIQNPLEIPAVWHGGMAFHGGLLGGILAAVLFARRRRLSLWSLFDVSAAATPIGAVFRPHRQFHQWRTVGPAGRSALCRRLPRRRSAAAASEPAL